MNETVDTDLKKLIIHDLTEEQFEQLTPEEKQLYLTPDTTQQDIEGALLAHNNNVHAHEDIRKALETYIHEQGVASATWTINHNLNKFPAVSVVDSAGNEIVAEVSYPDKNTCIVTMVGASKGKAYLN